MTFDAFPSVAPLATVTSMYLRGTVPRLLAFVALSAAPTGCAHESSSSPASDHEVLRHELPRELGDHANVTLLEVVYPPGGSSRPHRHPCPVVAYVEEGAVRTQKIGRAHV